MSADLSRIENVMPAGWPNWAILNGWHDYYGENGVLLLFFFCKRLSSGFIEKLFAYLVDEAVQIFAFQQSNIFWLTDVRTATGASFLSSHERRLFYAWPSIWEFQSRQIGSLTDGLINCSPATDYQVMQWKAEPAWCMLSEHGGALACPAPLYMEYQPGCPLSWTT